MRPPSSHRPGSGARSEVTGCSGPPPWAARPRTSGRMISQGSLRDLVGAQSLPNAQGSGLLGGPAPPAPGRGLRSSVARGPQPLPSGPCPGAAGRGLGVRLTTRRPVSPPPRPAPPPPPRGRSGRRAGSRGTPATTMPISQLRSPPPVALEIGPWYAGCSRGRRSTSSPRTCRRRGREGPSS